MPGNANGNGKDEPVRDSDDPGRGFSVEPTKVPVRKYPQPKYPRKGWDFPRRWVEITPDEILYDPDRILGSYVKVKRVSTGETILHQPRVESTGYYQEQEIDDRPYPSQIPYFKEQIHLKPSRDAEILSVSGKVDVPANSTVTVVEFTTFNNLRTFIKWVSNTVWDALDPENIVITLLVDGAPRKMWAKPDVTVSGGGYNPLVIGPVSTPTGLWPCLPIFQNSLFEITDQHHVAFAATNLDPVATRKVGVCIWGWIESVTVWDEKVKR